MQHVLFRAWLAEVDDLTPEQGREVEAVLAGRAPLPPLRLHALGRPGPGRRSAALPVQDCGKSFNALTGTPLARLRQKGHWLDFGRALSEGDTVVDSAERCGVAVGGPLFSRWLMAIPG